MLTSRPSLKDLKDLRNQLKIYNGVTCLRENILF